MKTILIRASAPYRGSQVASGAETVTVSPAFAEDGLTANSGGIQGGAPPTEALQPAEANVSNVAADNPSAVSLSGRLVRPAEETMPHCWHDCAVKVLVARE